MRRNVKYSAYSHPLCQNVFVCADMWTAAAFCITVLWEFADLTARARRLLCCRRMECGEGKVGMGGATEIDMVTLFLSRLVERWRCCSSVTPKCKCVKLHNQCHLCMAVILMCKASKCLTSVQGSETELSVSVQLLQTWWSGARMKNIVLLVPWSLIVKWQLALYIQVWHRCDERETKHFNSPMMTQGSKAFSV